MISDDLMINVDNIRYITAVLKVDLNGSVAEVWGAWGVVANALKVTHGEKRGYTYSIKACIPAPKQLLDLGSVMIFSKNQYLPL